MTQTSAAPSAIRPLLPIAVQHRADPPDGRQLVLAPPLQPADITQLHDRELGLALLAGHAGAPREAWRRFAPMVGGILRRFLGPGTEVEDCTQEVFLCLFKKLRCLRDPGALRAFVMAIAIRIGRRQGRRSSARCIVLADDPDLAERKLAPCEVRAQYAVVRLYRLLSLLRERERTAFVLRFIEVMQTDEIAWAMGASNSTVRRSFRRAKVRVYCLAQQDAFLVDYMREQN